MCCSQKVAKQDIEECHDRAMWSIMNKPKNPTSRKVGRHDRVGWSIMNKPKKLTSRRAESHNRVAWSIINKPKKPTSRRVRCHDRRHNRVVWSILNRPKELTSQEATGRHDRAAWSIINKSNKPTTQEAGYQGMPKPRCRCHFICISFYTYKKMSKWKSVMSKKNYFLKIAKERKKERLGTEWLKTKVKKNEKKEKMK